MKRKDPIAEARRYVENAKETLRENGDLDVELRAYHANDIIDRCEIMLPKQ